MRTLDQKQNPRSPASPTPAPPRADLIQQAQHTMGNQAVQQLLQRHAEEFEDTPASATSLAFEHDHDANWNRRKHFVPQKAPNPRAKSRPNAAWAYGPVTELKSAEHDLGTYVGWVKEVERAYGPNNEAVLQRLRRLYYSNYGGALGDKFDAVIADQAGAEGPPLTSIAISFEALDGLYETGTVRTPAGDSVDVSHVLAALDLKTAGTSQKAAAAEQLFNVRFAGVLTWTGDLAWWFVQWVERQKDLNASPSTEPATEAGPATEIGGLSARDVALMNELAVTKTSKDDLLGDIDGTVIAEANVSPSTFEHVKAEGRAPTHANIDTELSMPVSEIMERYYAPSAGTSQPAGSRQRFPDFVRHASPPIPYATTSAGGVTLTADAEAAIYSAIGNTAELFLSRMTHSASGANARVKYALILHEMARRFTRFLETGLAKGDAPWP